MKKVFKKILGIFVKSVEIHSSGNALGILIVYRNGRLGNFIYQKHNFIVIVPHIDRTVKNVTMVTFLMWTIGHIKNINGDE